MALYDKMIKAIKKEIIIRSKNYNDEIQTIYYGGGTPSLLKIKDINDIFKSIQNKKQVIITGRYKLIFGKFAKSL